MFGKTSRAEELRQDTIDKIIDGVVADESVVFHGGCVGCLLSLNGENKTLAGIEYCRGCMYMQWRTYLPDKSMRSSRNISGSFNRDNIKAALRNHRNREEGNAR